ncbi:MAG: DHH family phosphoesterase [bacterium]|nr:DHH family phosphoesterase [bacterium]
MRGTGPAACPVEAIREIVAAHDRFAVLSHEEPDGDAVGSQVALALALRRLGKEVVSCRVDGVPRPLDFLNAEGAIEPYRPSEHADRIVGAQVIAILDSCAPYRLGEFAPLVERSGALLVNIDHHRDNALFGAVNFVRYTAGGTAELVYEVIRAAGVPVGGTIAEAIYVGMSTDTLGFKYIDPDAHMIAIVAELARGGLDIERLHERLYYFKPDGYLEDLAALIGGAAYEDGGRVAWFTFPGDGHLTYYQRELASEALHLILSLERVRAVAMLHEERRGIEVWLRSKVDVNVGGVAAGLGGGGHRTAAGALIPGRGIEEATRAVLSAVRDAISS